ncbi:MAG: hypothetical protein MHM6MM_002948 [Cercozoa sp. M6MM]
MGRTNTASAWTNDLDDCLKRQVEQVSVEHRIDWDEVSKYVPGMTSSACCTRWTSSFKEASRRQPWTEGERDLLRGLVAEAVGNEKEVNLRTADWRRIASMMRRRTCKQVRDQWNLQLDPKIDRDRWSEEENVIILKLHVRFGTSWTKIARELNKERRTRGKDTRRTDNQIKNHWYSTLRKRAGEVEVSAAQLVKRKSVPKRVASRRVAEELDNYISDDEDTQLQAQMEAELAGAHANEETAGDGDSQDTQSPTHESTTPGGVTPDHEETTPSHGDIVDREDDARDPLPPQIEIPMRRHDLDMIPSLAPSIASDAVPSLAPFASFNISLPPYNEQGVHNSPRYRLQLHPRTPISRSPHLFVTRPSKRRRCSAEEGGDVAEEDRSTPRRKAAKEVHLDDSLRVPENPLFSTVSLHGFSELVDETSLSPNAPQLALSEPSSAFVSRGHLHGRLDEPGFRLRLQRREDSTPVLSEHSMAGTLPDDPLFLSSEAGALTPGVFRVTSKSPLIFTDMI